MSGDCSEALERLYTYLDQELDAASVVVIKGHLDGCSPCCDAFSFEQRLLTVIRTALQEDVPSVVIERLRTAIRTATL